MYNVIERGVRLTTVAVEKPVSMTYSECLSVGSVIQHAKRKHDSHLWPELLYHIFRHHLINGKT